MMEPLSPWAALARTLMQAEESLPTVYDRSIHLGDDSEDRCHKLEALDEALQEEIDAALDSCTRGDHWPRPIDPQTNELLRMRLRAALTFVLQHIESEEADSPVTLPYPPMGPMDLMRWLTIDWWYLHGRLSYAQDRA